MSPPCDATTQEKTQVRLQSKWDMDVRHLLHAELSGEDGWMCAAAAPSDHRQRKHKAKSVLGFLFKVFVQKQ